MYSFLIAALTYGYLVVHGTNPQVAPAVRLLSGPCYINSREQNICSGSGSWTVLPSGVGRAKAYCQIACHGQHQQRVLAALGQTERSGRNDQELRAGGSISAVKLAERARGHHAHQQEA
jgi:hypothetical protein